MSDQQSYQFEDHLQNLNFEEAFLKLGEIVQSLEKGGLALTEATNIYEHGMALANYCNQLLDETKLRITEITQNNSPFSSVEDE